MTRVKPSFKKDKALIAYITCGDPDFATTSKAIEAAVINGASLIELAIPFSDSACEGRDIYASHFRALNNGVRTANILDFVKNQCQKLTVPIVFVTYANIIFSYGADAFIAKCIEVGIKGLVVVDLPFEERTEFLPYCQKYGVKLITTVAPSNQKRIVDMARSAEGFIEVMLNGEENVDDVAAMLKEIKQNAEVPLIMNHDLFRHYSVKAGFNNIDGVVVKLEIIKLLETYGTHAPEHIGHYIASVRAFLKQIK